MTFLLGFLIGSLVGVTVAVGALALATMSHESDARQEVDE